VNARRLLLLFEVKLAILRDGCHFYDGRYEEIKEEVGIMLGKTGSVWTG
jgi:hypothetical protein